MIEMKWYDYLLKWDKNKHSKVTYVHYLSNEIWKPDITLLNDDDEERDKKLKVHRLIVNSNGKVLWRFPTTLVSSCSLDVTRWPMDTQECKLMFGSSAFGQRRLKIIGVNKTQNASISSGEWSLKSIKMHEGFYDHGDGRNYSMVQYKLTIDRKPAYTLFYLSPPSIILAILTFMSFCIPSESGERIGFVTTILLTMMVFLLLLPEYLPRTSDGLPVLGILLIVAMVIIAIVLMATIVIVKFYHSEGFPPSWIQKLFCFLSPFEGFSLKKTLPMSFLGKIGRKVSSGQLPFTITPNEVELETISSLPFEPRIAFGEDVKKITWKDLSIRLNWFLFGIILCAFLITCAYLFSLN
ncbi:Neuronal acetylcholine receptor subunit alpha-7 [Exaiptasia diaphana]|nr:Neuronal acetylcholine receptor subunit alpha-7 [Exaiptasia diaphana]